MSRKVLVRRRFDDLWERALLRGNFAALSFLILGALVVVLFGAIALSVTGIEINAEGDGFLHAAWEVLLRAMSPDQLAGQTSWPARILLLLVTIIGLLMFSTLISISNSSMSERFERVRRGRKPISLKGHFAILNWNEFGFRVLREIAEANRTTDRPHHVTVLCDQDPLELMRLIEANFREHSDSAHDSSRWTRHPDSWITVRRGLSHHTTDLLKLAAVDLAAGAIVLHEDETSDSQVVRSVLAISATLRSNQTRESGPTEPLPVVTFNSGSALAVSLDNRLTTIANSRHRHSYRHINYIPLSPEEIRVGIETQVARHRGLSYVYQDLLDFGGEELYIVEPPHGFSTFADAFHSLSKAIPLGIFAPDGVELWPNWNRPIVNEPLIVLAPDRLSAHIRNSETVARLDGARKSGRPPLAECESFLFVGWNSSGDELLKSLPEVVAQGSTLKVLLRRGEKGPEVTSFAGTPIQITQRDISDPLDDPRFLDDVNHVVVLADMTVSSEESDAQALTDLLACRHYADQISDPSRRFTIVGELRRRSSRHVAGVRLADDLLVSESLMAAAATQLMFEPRLEGVINALLSRNNPVEIISAPLYMLTTDDRISWSELQLRLASETGEIAIGVRSTVNGEPRVVLNPRNGLDVVRDDEVVLISKHNRS